MILYMLYLREIVTNITFLIPFFNFTLISYTFINFDKKKTIILNQSFLWLKLIPSHFQSLMISWATHLRYPQHSKNILIQPSPPPLQSVAPPLHTTVQPISAPITRHPMTTRSKDGTRKQRTIINLHTSTISPLPKSYL